MKAIEDDLLSLVKRPARYAGGEWNSIRKAPDSVAVRWALCFPDIYDVGMSHLGLQILYHVLNGCEGVACERAFLPWPDYAELLQRERAALSSLETRTPLADFDVVGFSVNYELAYPSVVRMLQLGGVPIRSAGRDNRSPLVVAGGPCMFNPEPLAPFLDAVALGDGEDLVLEITDVVRRAKASGEHRADTLTALSRVHGVYVPSLYEAEYEGTRFIRIQTADAAPVPVVSRTVGDLDAAPFPSAPIVPFVETVHDRAVVEIMRGCTQGCRFCHAGMTCRPVRERSADTVCRLARQIVDATGHDEVGLLSLSAADHSGIETIVDRLLAEFADEYVSLSVPSQRVDAFSVGLCQKVAAVRKSGITLAPEAGTQRLRDAINKRATDADILSAVEAAFSAGYHTVKLYFMIGLPTETEEDVLGILATLERIREAADASHVKRRGPLANVSLATFVPKPHTPFQWERQLSVGETRAKQELLARQLRKSSPYRLRWHDAEQSQVEGVLARGDRRMAGVVERVAASGAGPQAWTEFFSLALWLGALAEEGLCLDDAIAERREDAPLPWEHLSTGVSRPFLLAERARSRVGATTPDCRREGCQRCGDVCDRVARTEGAAGPQGE